MILFPVMFMPANWLLVLLLEVAPDTPLWFMFVLLSERIKSLPKNILSSGDLTFLLRLYYYVAKATPV